MSLSLFLCLLSFAVCYWAGKRSLASGLIAVIAFGYAYGITRANLPETFSISYSIAGVVGLFAAQLFHRLSPLEQFRVGHLRPWLEFLLPGHLAPANSYSGLAYSICRLAWKHFPPAVCVFGRAAYGDDRYRLAIWIAGLNCWRSD